MDAFGVTGGSERRSLTADKDHVAALEKARAGLGDPPA
jgi:hypothetical protein